MSATKRIVIAVLVAVGLAVSGGPALGHDAACAAACFRVARAAAFACYVNATTPEEFEACLRTVVADLEVCLEACP